MAGQNVSCGGGQLAGGATCRVRGSSVANGGASNPPPCFRPLGETPMFEDAADCSREMRLQCLWLSATLPTALRLYICLALQCRSAATAGHTLFRVHHSSSPSQLHPRFLDAQRFSINIILPRAKHHQPATPAAAPPATSCPKQKAPRRRMEFICHPAVAFQTRCDPPHMWPAL